MTFHHGAQVFQRVELNLPHTLSRHTDLRADLFECETPIAVQTEPAFHDGALFVTEFADPVLDNIVHGVFVRAP